MLLAVLIVLLHTMVAVVCGWLYFRRYAITRPPVGVFGLWDIVMMMAAIIVLPFLYIALPSWLVVLLIGSGAISVMYFMWEPVLSNQWLSWLLTLLFAGADIMLARWYGTSSMPFIVLNNIVMIMMTVGITNLWAQSGMRARELVVLGLGLMMYDYVATWYFNQMSDMFTRLADLPLVPMFVWKISATEWVGLGLGDALLATVFPLVMRKAFKRRAGVVAMAVALGTITAIMAAPLVLGLTDSIFPVMMVLGPLMALQYIYWRRRAGPERKTWQYLRAEPLSSRNQ